MVTLFVSYARADFEDVQPILTRLQVDGISYWLDQQRLNAGDLWEVVLREQIDAQDRFLMFISPNQLQSLYCRGEFQYALSRGKPIIPVLLSPCEAALWLEIPPINYIPYYQDPERGYHSLHKSLCESAVPLSRLCPICQQASLEDGSPRCPHCQSVFKPSALGDLFRCSPVKLRQYADHFVRRVTPNSAPFDALIALTLAHICLKDYPTAAAYLKQAQQTANSSPYAWYLRALVALHGERPAALHTDFVRAAHKHLLAALELDPAQAHAALLLAWIKEDGLQRHGFAVGSPTISECAQYALVGRSSAAELLMLAETIPFTDGIAFTALRAVLDRLS
jgi:tetratricopeptide (TPR) repeat protein